jgi:hypothetical protein
MFASENSGFVLFCCHSDKAFVAVNESYLQPLQTMLPLTDTEILFDVLHLFVFVYRS